MKEQLRSKKVCTTLLTIKSSPGRLCVFLEIKLVLNWCLGFFLSQRISIMLVEKYTEECCLEETCYSWYQIMWIFLLSNAIDGNSSWRTDWMTQFLDSKFEADYWIVSYILMYSLHIWLDLIFSISVLSLKIKIFQISPKPCNQ